jgi:tripartite-type tricarboxylate transporter receptor subunit TctC
MRHIAVAAPIVWVAAACVIGGPVQAQSVEDFYRGKQISLVIGTSPGGDYDLRGRMLARYMGKYIPGNPTIVPRNMPAGVGLQAASWLYSVAPKDGTSLHMVMQNMPMHQVLGGQGVQFDAGQFNWIGNTTNSPNTVATWHTTGVRTVEDARKTEVIVGAPGTATSSVYYPMVMNALLGTRFKIIAGYPGGNDVNLAMERGEVGGRGSNSWASWVSTKPDWLKEKKVHMLVQIGLSRHPDMPDVPLLTELAANEQDRAVLRFMSADTAFSRALATTPEVPADRVRALRRAFDAAMKDADLVAESAKAQRDLSADTGEEVQKVVMELIQTPPAVIERTKAILAGATTVEKINKP